MDLSIFAASKSPAPIVSQNGDAPSTETATDAENSVSEQAEEFNTFLELLTAQIRNQDPLAPVDSTQFVDQLATFSNLELQAKNNQILEGIATLLASHLPAPSAGDSASES